MPRGIRNNNPLNIRYSPANRWQGQIGVDDKGFVIFRSPELGVRAAFKILESYRKKGIDTIKDIIYRWAPPEDNNDTKTYINSVSKIIDKNSFSKIVTPQDKISLLVAMAKIENGKTLDPSIFHNAYKLV
ncbi:MAG: structural protein [Proteobacteria bacterium]|nr:MAG: structural protein [Pseudomonadota bacterium]